PSDLMLAVTGLGTDALTAVLATEGFTDLDLANLNAPDQTVLSGPTGSLRALAAVVRRGGTGRATLIDAPNPGHSRYMATAAAGFAEALAQLPFRAPRIPVVSNVTARPHRPERLAELLAQHLYRPVRWSESMTYLSGAGSTRLRQAGSGGLLPKLWPACTARDVTPARCPTLRSERGPPRPAASFGSGHRPSDDRGERGARREGSDGPPLRGGRGTARAPGPALPGPPRRHAGHRTGPRSPRPRLHHPDRAGAARPPARRPVRQPHGAAHRPGRRGPRPPVGRGPPLGRRPPRHLAHRRADSRVRRPGGAGGVAVGRPRGLA